MTLAVLITAVDATSPSSTSKGMCRHHDQPGWDEHKPLRQGIDDQSQYA
ncbi:MAG: hypothetical protein IJ719_15035 [Clostridia bacterium]|nr:hypothetical protein [Clostridia bacterium]